MDYKLFKKVCLNKLLKEMPENSFILVWIKETSLFKGIFWACWEFHSTGDNKWHPLKPLEGTWKIELHETQGESLTLMMVRKA